MRRLTQIALLGAIAFVFLHFLEFPRGPFQPYLKYDPSDIPALIAAFAIGPLAGIGVEVVKAVLLSFLPPPGNLGGPFGIFMNFLAGATMAGVAGGYYLLEHTKAGAIKALTFGVLAVTVVMVIANVALTPIFYGIPRPTVLGLVVPALIPFNILKGTLSAIVTYILYKRVRVYLYEWIGDRVAW